MYKSLLIFLAVNSVINLHSQQVNTESKFSIHGSLVDRDTGKVVLWYSDIDNINMADTAIIVGGKFNFSGTINKACDAFLWTNIQIANFSDPSVVRFLLEPGKIFIEKTNDSANAIITGSASQAEKEAWIQQNLSLLEKKNYYWDAIYSINQNTQTNTNAYFIEQKSFLNEKIDSINTKIRRLDEEYIRSHPNSYLSAHLLYLHRKRLVQNSVKEYYSSFAANVKNSSLGYDVLKYIYPLTDDEKFRQENTLLGKQFNEDLSAIKSLYDFNLIDTSGGIVNFSSFKDKYLVIDFWASWCKPCIDNIPAWNQLIKDYGSKNIKFISISLDEDIQKWKKSIIRHNYTGIHVIDLKTFNSLIAVYSKVVALPRYIIADKSGQIINYQAPGSGDPEIKKLLDNLIK
ncbi:MAG: AhpC/TSA family protein [Nitrosopumilus sp.]|nr:AhpC/TSA family protein [Nitrosopumilus sp.]